MRDLKKLLISVTIILIAGCGTMISKSGGLSYTEKPIKQGIERKFKFAQPQETSEPTTIQISTNGTAVVSFGAQYDVQTTKSKFAAFKPYHVSAIACIALGVVIIALGWTKTVYGVYLIGLGLFLGAWASFVPSNGSISLILSGAGALIGVVYSLIKYKPKD